MRREAIAFLVMATLLLLTTAGVQAKAVTIGPLLACEYVTDAPEQVDRFWIDNEGVSHWRHQLWTSEVYVLPGKVGDAKPFAFNAGWEDRNLDANGNGDKLGYFNDGTFEGHYGGTYISGIAYVSFVGHGPDNQQFSGTILEPSAECANGGNLAEAFLLMPHG